MPLYTVHIKWNPNDRRIVCFACDRAVYGRRRADQMGEWEGWAMNVPRPCTENDGYANPDDRVDRLGRLFATLRLNEKYGITFVRYFEMVESGSWASTFGESA